MDRLDALGQQISDDYEDQDLLVIGVLKGSALFAADVVRRISNPRLEMDWTTVTSYGAGTKTSGVVPAAGRYGDPGLR